MSKNILLVYEEIPERTVILYLNATDLEAAKLSYEEIASIHGTYQNNSDLTQEQEKIHGKVSEAVFGPWNEEKRESDPAVWRSRIIFATGDVDMTERVPGVNDPPPKIDLGAIVVHCGFAL